MRIKLKLTVFFCMLLITGLACETLSPNEDATSESRTLEPATQTEEVTPESTSLFEDDFSNQNSGWPVTNDASGFNGYNQGNYRIFVTQPNLVLWATPGQNFTNVSIEVQTTKLGGDDDNQFGVICRHTDLNNLYAIMISSDGYYGFFKKINNSDLTLIGSEQMNISDAINQGDAANQLRVDCIGIDLALYVNDTLVDQVQDSDLTSGDIGLIAGTFDIPGTDIQFDNFVVTNP
ncbi:MAG: hypothetical protein FVQ83_06710 [Chloroflexi bacterium]|nr:hypothetical protein [Chloroflexota bacterium]